MGTWLNRCEMKHFLRRVLYKEFEDDFQGQRTLSLRARNERVKDHFFDYEFDHLQNPNQTRFALRNRLRVGAFEIKGTIRNTHFDAYRIDAGYHQGNSIVKSKTVLSKSLEFEKTALKYKFHRDRLSNTVTLTYSPKVIFLTDSLFYKVPAFTTGFLKGFAASAGGRLSMNLSSQRLANYDLICVLDNGNTQYSLSHLCELNGKFRFGKVYFTAKRNLSNRLGRVLFRLLYDIENKHSEMAVVSEYNFSQGCVVKNRISSNYSLATALSYACLLYTSPSPRDRQKSRMPSSA
eukprot:TRINITY_DN9132_c0_g1_i3.p1 TRINITY_DN9132_c0_g1~~TRINITY_DN9132_c0_g1_i3.p1  ORF type:complete len:292 (-),score=58.96 TRINITY_DN9132_c0_g1_i3:39-914(-)